MAVPTERAVRRKPMAVIMLTAERKGKTPFIDNQAREGADFEWFETHDGRRAFFTQMDKFHRDDSKKHDDFCYVTVEIIDTEGDMKLGKVNHHPKDNADAEQWAKDIKADPTKVFQPVQSRKKDSDEEDDGGEPAKVKPRKKSEAKKAAEAKADEAPAPKPKAAALKAKLAAKNGAAKKSETGDPAPTPKRVRKPAAKKAEKESVSV